VRESSANWCWYVTSVGVLPTSGFTGRHSPVSCSGDWWWSLLPAVVVELAPNRHFGRVLYKNMRDAGSMPFPMENFCYGPRNKKFEVKNHFVFSLFVYRYASFPDNSPPDREVENVAVNSAKTKARECRRNSRVSFRRPSWASGERARGNASTYLGTIAFRYDAEREYLHPESGLFLWRPASEHCSFEFPVSDCFQYFRVFTSRCTFTSL
jgi:hypothetical protein